MDFAITNATLLTMVADGLGIIDYGAIGVIDGEISFVGRPDDLIPQDYEEVIDGKHKLIMPGLINAHFHSTSTLFKGCAQDVPEIEWMNKAIGPLGRHLEPADQILGSKLAVIEGLMTGTTTFAEYSGMVQPLLDEVYEPWNVRCVASDVINEISANRAHLGPKDLYEFDTSKGESGLKRNLELVHKYKNSNLISTMLGPQALDMISPDLLTTVYEEAQTNDVGIHMHVAQGQRERLQIEGRYGDDKSTIAVLNEHDFLNEKLLAAHCHDTTEQERIVMKDSDVRMVSCQSSIGIIDGIVPPLSHYASIGGVAGIGTDQVPGVGHANMFKEMRTASIFAKVSNRDPTALPPWQLLRIATLGGAKALRISDKVGSLEEGKQADLVIINLKAPTLGPVITRPLHSFVPNLVYSSTGYEVEGVYIAGKVVVKNNELKVADASEIYRMADSRVQDLLDQAESDWRAAGSQLVKAVDNGLL